MTRRSQPTTNRYGAPVTTVEQRGIARVTALSTRSTVGRVNDTRREMTP